MKSKLFIIIYIAFCVLPGKSIFAQDKIHSNKIIKVLTFNIYHGETMNHDFDLDKIADVINNANPDFVALQEVDFKTKRAGKIDLATVLAYKTKMIPVFGKAMDYDGGEYGDAILSKYSFLQTKKFNLPYISGYEPRTAVQAIIVLPDGDTISFVSTHLDHKKESNVRLTQAKKINKIFLKNKYPVILAGDLNDTPGSKTILILEKYWTSTYNKIAPEPTYPYDNPVKKIDYVMFYPATKFKLINREVIHNPFASDHCAYLVTLEILN